MERPAWQIVVTLFSVAPWTSRLKETAKYDGVTMIVGSNDRDGEVTLHRNVGRNQVEVISTIDGMIAATYDVNYRKGAKNPPLNEVWLKLIGIEQKP